MKLNYRRTFLLVLLYVISHFGSFMIALYLDSQTHLEIGDTLAGGIMALDNILAYSCPLVRSPFDRVRMNIGKRMPFILGGTAIAVLSMVLIPVADNPVSLPRGGPARCFGGHEHLSLAPWP